MEQKRLLAVSEQDFALLRRNGGVYVDKTDLVWDIAHSGKVQFLSRPRRFGKSLLVSTLKAYFQADREVFQGLKLEALEAQRGEAAWAEYPVLHFDFSVGEFETLEDLKTQLLFVLEGYRKIYNATPANSIPTLFCSVLDAANQLTQRRVVILIDEYDNPLTETLSPERKSLHEAYKSVLRSFYKVIKARSASIHFVFITGITRFSELGLFSGMNQIEDISFDAHYAALCGMTREEIEETYSPELDEMARELALSHTDLMGALREAYNGYRFSKSDISVYNPYSLLYALKKREIGFYWFNTATPYVLRTLFPQYQWDAEDLQQTHRMGEEGLRRTGWESGNPTALLFQAGYYTILSYDREFHDFELGIPNSEVRFGLMQELLPAMLQEQELFLDLSVVAKFARAIRRGDTAQLMRFLGRFIALSPYCNQRKDSPVHEDVFRNTIYVLFWLLGYYVHVEHPNARGRADVLLETDSRIYALEFKRDEGEGTMQRALAQITSQSYCEPLLLRGKPVHAIGIVFSRQGVVEWKEEVVEG